jgi:uncharacterized protein YegL
MRGEQPEFFDNPEPRCPVVLLLDTSASMEGDPIRELNEAIVMFNESVCRDLLASLRVEVMIITFGEIVELKQDFVTVPHFYPPTLETDGTDSRTFMGNAIQYALDVLEDRKITYRTNGIEYYQPWIFLITDGAPTDDWFSASQRVHQAEKDEKLSFFVIGVEGANFDVLQQIAPPSRPPLTLNGLNFNDLFVWLDQDLPLVGGGQDLPLEWGNQASSTSSRGKGELVIGAGFDDLPPVGWGQRTQGSMLSAPVPTAPAPLENSSTIDAELKKLTSGKVIFDTPYCMKVGITERVSVRIAKTITQDFLEGLAYRQEAKIENVRISRYMTVSLKGDDFKIEALGNEEQIIEDNDFTQWDWKILPLKGGNRKLWVSITIQVEAENEQARKTLPVLEKEIPVKINPFYSANTFVSQNWQWLIASAIIPVVGLLLKK